ncbi:MAG: HlyD family efflux transporter periplasmic adaptor subunit, partial [bacterium]|nr:HlyD family efflux transporter periplasmic adaptor subunit [bacterium]
NLYTIADLSSVWVLADIYEYELPWVALGQEGVVELSYLPGRKFTGPVTHVSPFLDPKTRTAQIRLELPNLDRALKPEMFGNTVIAGMPREGVLAVSQDAIIHSGRRSLVIVALGEGRFDPRDVELGLDSGDGWIEVTRGVSPGEEVVVSGQFLIDSESNLQEAVKKLLAGAPGEGESPTPASSPAPEHEHHLMNGGE